MYLSLLYIYFALFAFFIPNQSSWYFNVQYKHKKNSQCLALITSRTQHDYWPSGTRVWCRLLTVTNVSKDRSILRLLEPEDGGTTIRRNVGNYSPVDAV